MQECEFANITAARPLASTDKAQFFSDNDELAIGDNLGGPIVPPEETFPSPISASSAIDFQEESDDFFVSVKSVCF